MCDATRVPLRSGMSISQYSSTDNQNTEQYHALAEDRRNEVSLLGIGLKFQVSDLGDLFGFARVERRDRERDDSEQGDDGAEYYDTFHRAFSYQNSHRLRSAVAIIH